MHRAEPQHRTNLAAAPAGRDQEQVAGGAGAGGLAAGGGGCGAAAEHAPVRPAAGPARPVAARVAPPPRVCDRDLAWGTRSPHPDASSVLASWFISTFWFSWGDTKLKGGSSLKAPGSVGRLWGTLLLRQPPPRPPTLAPALSAGRPATAPLLWVAFAPWLNVKVQGFPSLPLPLFP